jgi:hypothetical protein
MQVISVYSTAIKHTRLPPFSISPRQGCASYITVLNQIGHGTRDYYRLLITVTSASRIAGSFVNTAKISNSIAAFLSGRDENHYSGGY